MTAASCTVCFKMTMSNDVPELDCCWQQECVCNVLKLASAFTCNKEQWQVVKSGGRLTKTVQAGYV